MPEVSGGIRSLLFFLHIYSLPGKNANLAKFVMWHLQNGSTRPVFCHQPDTNTLSNRDEELITTIFTHINTLFIMSFTST